MLQVDKKDIIKIEVAIIRTATIAGINFVFQLPEGLFPACI